MSAMAILLGCSGAVEEAADGKADELDVAIDEIIGVVGGTVIVIVVVDVPTTPPVAAAGGTVATAGRLVFEKSGSGPAATADVSNVVVIEPNWLPPSSTPEPVEGTAESGRPVAVPIVFSLPGFNVKLLEYEVVVEPASAEASDRLASTLPGSGLLGPTARAGTLPVCF